jgi:hypothetical protein
MSINDGDILWHVTEFVLAGGQIEQNKFTWRWTGTSHPEAGVVSALISWTEDFYELMAPCMPSSIDSVNVNVDRVEWNAVDEVWEVVQNVGFGVGSLTLTGTDDTLPLQCCPCLVGNTERPRSKGRKFLPLWNEITQNASVIAAGFLDELAAALAEYLATHIVETGKALTPGVASTVTGTFLPFISGLVNAFVFTQRRRNLGYGA